MKKEEMKEVKMMIFLPLDKGCTETETHCQKQGKSLALHLNKCIKVMLRQEPCQERTSIVRFSTTEQEVREEMTVRHILQTAVFQDLGLKGGGGEDLTIL